MEKENLYYATGKRKNAIARTWLKPGTGEININNRPIENYFPTEILRANLVEPFKLTNTMALILADPDLRMPLKKAGFIKRDPRVKERKKYGQKGARARFQFSKR